MKHLRAEILTDFWGLAMALTPRRWRGALGAWLLARYCDRDQHLMLRPKLRQNIAGKSNLSGRASVCGLCHAARMQREDFAAGFKP